MTTDPLCALDKEPERRPATHGLICRSHDFRLRLSLNSLRDNWQSAADQVDGFDGAASSPTFGRTATRVHSPVPIDIGRIDRTAKLDEIGDRLAYWARAVASARGIAPESFPRRPAGRIDLLRLHLPWIVANPAVVQFDAELHQLAARVRAMAGRPGGGEPVGLCAQRVRAGRCEGELLKDRAGVVRCHRDPSHIDHVRAKPKGAG